ncbi:hypothetical protein KCV00_g55, partial [Aureobasidium melanogenum]
MLLAPHVLGMGKCSRIRATAKTARYPYASHYHNVTPADRDYRHLVTVLSGISASLPLFQNLVRLPLRINDSFVAPVEALSRE